MYRNLYLLFVLLLFVSCKSMPGSDKRFETVDTSKIYRLHLNPANGSKYYYDISNETAIKLEVNDTKIDNINRTTIAVSYAISKDSLGNFFN